MKIVMDEMQYQELECLVGIFEGAFFDHEEVQCFSLIKDIVDGKYDMNSISEEEKEKMHMQLTEAFEWIESINGKIEYKSIYLSFFPV